MKDQVLNRVQELRKKKQVTQETMATDIGITRQTIIAIERGNYTPSVALALKIAHYFATTVENVFFLDYDNH